MLTPTEFHNRMWTHRQDEEMNDIISDAQNSIREFIADGALGLPEGIVEAIKIVTDSSVIHRIEAHNLYEAHVYPVNFRHRKRRSPIKKYYQKQTTKQRYEMNKSERIKAIENELAQLRAKFLEIEEHINREKSLQDARDSLKNTLEISERILSELLKEQESKENWRAENRGTYWFIDEAGLSFSTVEMGSITDDRRHKVGNYFRTEEEAKNSPYYFMYNSEYFYWHLGMPPLKELPRDAEHFGLVGWVKAFNEDYKGYRLIRYPKQYKGGE